MTKPFPPKSPATKSFLSKPLPWMSLALASLLAAGATSAWAMPRWPAADLSAQAAARLPSSPVPRHLSRSADLILVRDMRQAGGGACWNHCYSAYDDCMSRNGKNMCVAQIKTCMETCDRLSNQSNPIPRTSNPQR